MMGAHKLFLHEAIGETRAVCVDRHERPVALFHERWAERGTRLRWGQVASGVIRKLAPGDGGAFIALEGGQEGFLARHDLTGLVEGTRRDWRVVAEARAGKLAKLSEAGKATETGHTALERWQQSIPGAAALAVDGSPGAARLVGEIFDDALSPVMPLVGGGRLQITPTPALVAVDVDTVGRVDKGRASARAKAVGLAAAQALARAAALRGLGGAIVLDCIAPLARRDGPALKKQFVDTFSALSTRRVDCLPPSPFGLMEAVLEWRWQPLYEAYFDTKGAALPEAIMLDGLRQIERAAKANPADQLRLSLPEAAYSAFVLHRKMYQTALIEHFGARIEVVQTSREKIEVSSL